MMILPKFVTTFHDRHGTQRYRFRRKGYRSAYLPSPESPGFEAAYHTALNGIPAGPPSNTKRPARISPIAAPAPGVSYVYFIGGPNGHVKIGTSRNLPSRIVKLRTGSPSSLRILAITPGGEELERSYHTLFAGSRIRGEWFRRTPELATEIGRLRRSVSNQRVELDTSSGNQL